MADTITGVEARLWEVLQPYLDAEGVELDDLDIRGSGRGRVVRVYVDAPDGVGVDHIAQLSRGLSRLLDEQDPFDGAYTLEVSSPGLERALRRERHYEKAVGREVDVKTSIEVDGAKRHKGVLRGLSDGAAEVEVDGASRMIPLSSVSAATTVFRWEKSPKPGKRGTR